MGRETLNDPILLAQFREANIATARRICAIALPAEITRDPDFIQLNADAEQIGRQLMEERQRVTVSLPTEEVVVVMPNA